jgi:plastocyanin
MRAVHLLIILFVFAGIALAQEAEKKKVYMATINADGVQKVEILGSEYFYEPDYIIVRKGIPVEFIIKKEQSIVPHNIVIKEPDAGIDIKESMGTRQKVIRFTPLEAGKYPFYCDKKLLFFKSHREKGMEGILEVIE